MEKGYNMTTQTVYDQCLALGYTYEYIKWYIEAGIRPPNFNEKQRQWLKENER